MRTRSVVSAAYRGSAILIVRGKSRLISEQPDHVMREDSG